MHSGPARHLISIGDLSDDDLYAIVERAAAFSTGTVGRTRPLEDDVVGVYFSKTSTRTRTAFSAGALRLGARIIAYGPGDLQLNTGETSEDTGRVMSRMLDVLVARTAGDPAEMRAWANQDRMAVINAMSADEHPTQALTDLTTLLRHFGRINGLRVLYVGEGNNTASALALALTRYSGTELELRTPPATASPRPSPSALRSRRPGTAPASRSGTTWPASPRTRTPSTPRAGRPRAAPSPIPGGATSSHRSR